MDGVEEDAARWPGVDHYIEFAQTLMTKCGNLAEVHGIGKLQRKIGAELKFLRTLKKQDVNIQSSHLHSSNLCHFAGVVHALERVPGVVSVLMPFNSPTRSGNLVVDILGGHGHVWVKVIARKAQALHLVWAGQGQFGDRDLLNQAKEYVACAETNLHNFTPPMIYFAFYNHVTRPMADALSKLGIHVLGKVVPVDEDVADKISSVLLDDDFEDSCESFDEEGSTERQDDGHLLRKCPNNPVRSEDSLEDNCLVRTGEKELSYGLPHCHTSVTDRGNSPLGVSGCEEKDSDSLEDEGCVAKCLPLDPDRGISCLYDDSLNNPCRVSSTTTSIESKDMNENGMMLTGSLVDYRPADVSCIPVQESLAETYDSLVDSFSTKTALSDSTTTVKTLRTLDTKTSSMSFFDALFGHFVLSPPDFRTDGQILLDSFSPYQNSLEASHAHLVSNESSVSPIPPALPPLTRVSLDISTLITLVSSISHGKCHYVFKTKVLNLQAEEERRTSVLLALTKFLEGKLLLACDTAVSSFQTILDTLGGPSEKARAAQLLATVHVVADQPSARALSLKSQGKVKNRSKIVFGTGDQLRVVTVTCNRGFVRAAKNQSDSGRRGETDIHRDLPLDLEMIIVHRLYLQFK